MPRENKTLRILLVEDDDMDRALAHRALTRVDASITDAASLASAEALLKRLSFDCVLLDWRLPDGSANDFLRHVGRTFPRLPVVVLTGITEEGLAKLVLQHGAQDYLIKNDLGQNDLVRSVQYAIERHRARELTAQLDHAQRLASSGLLAAGVAHELNNPALVLMANLAAIQDAIDEAPDGDDGTTMASLSGLVDECTIALERIASLTRQLGRFSRRSQGTYERAAPAALIREALTLARPSTRSQAQVTLSLDDTAEIVVDRTALVGVFINLLVNAQQAMDTQPDQPKEIQIQLEQRDAGIAVTVEDSGPGVAPEDAERLFEPFFTRTSNGTGLGLAISKEIVAAHRGRIELRASSLGGAAFTVMLPLETGLIPAPKPELDRPSEGLEILVIDDELAVRKGIARMLNAHRVRTEPGAQEALDAIDGGYAPDVILCDLIMPGISGAEFVKLLSHQAPKLAPRTIFITGGASTPEARVFIERSSVEVLRKPFTASELLAVVARVVGPEPGSAPEDVAPDDG